MRIAGPWLHSGADDFLSKPCSEDELLEKMRSLLGIAYDYEEVNGAEDQPIPELTVVSSQSLGQLPRELLDELRSATATGNKRLLNKLILQVSQTEQLFRARSAATCRPLRLRFFDTLAGGSMRPVAEEKVSGKPEAAAFSLHSREGLTLLLALAVVLVIALLSYRDWLAISRVTAGPAGDATQRNRVCYQRDSSWNLPMQKPDSVGFC